MSINTYTQEDRIKILEAFDESGLTLKEFCRTSGINNRTIANWIKDRREKRGLFAIEPTGDTSFISVPVSRRGEVPQSSKRTTQPITLKKAGWTIEVPGEQLANVLKVLEGMYAL